MFLKFLLVLLTVIYVIILPINFLLWDIPYWIYNFIAIVVVVVLWIIPLYFLKIKNKINYLNIAFLVILNILIASYALYSGEKYWKELEYQNIQEAQKYRN